VLVQTEGPWDRPGTLYFYGGAFSMFAATPGLMLPEAWAGHPTPAQMRAVPTAEHWFHAVKGTSKGDFDWVLAAPNARSAKRRGGPSGEDGRRIQLREGWDDGISRQAMYAANLAKFSIEPFRSLLLLTGSAPLAEDSPTDDRWGCRDRAGAFNGRNWLGIALMEVRAALPARHGPLLHQHGLTATARPLRSPAAA